MAKQQLTIRQQAQLLVQNILSKKTLAANKILQNIIAQSERQRELEVAKIIAQQEQGDDLGDDDLGDDLGQGDDSTGDDEDDLGDDNLGDDLGQGDDSTGDDLGDEEEQMDNSKVEETIDDALEIQCQINAKRITTLFDTIAELNKLLEEKDLDVNSKEYIKYDVSISYYSDKLQEFQGKTNPGLDQSKLEEALDKITDALEQLKTQLGDNSDSVDADIQTPEEVGGANNTESQQSEGQQLEGQQPEGQQPEGQQPEGQQPEGEKEDQI